MVPKVQIKGIFEAWYFIVSISLCFSVKRFYICIYFLKKVVLQTCIYSRTMSRLTNNVKHRSFGWSIFMFKVWEEASSIFLIKNGRLIHLTIMPMYIKYQEIEDLCFYGGCFSSRYGFRFNDRKHILFKSFSKMFILKIKSKIL